MAYCIPMSENIETRKRIKEAAVRLFSTYGFGKTTMAEIGKECDMSAANLYRFYKNKQDIAAAIAEDHFALEQRIYKEITLRRDLTASEKIRAFANKSIDIASDFVKVHKKMFELLEYVCSEQKDLVRCHVEQKQSVMAEILAEGNRNGEFAVDDIVRTAGAVLKALIFFDYPAFLVTCPEKEIRASADDVVDLLLGGLRKR